MAIQQKKPLRWKSGVPGRRSRQDIVREYNLLSVTKEFRYSRELQSNFDVETSELFVALNRRRSSQQFSEEIRDDQCSDVSRILANYVHTEM